MRATPFAPMVVVPTYNNAGTLSHLLDALSAFQLPIVVVNDGSTDATQRSLDIRARANPHAALQIERHRRNRGKARALLTGFAAAARQGATHAVTIDSDGQHDPGDIGHLLRLARSSPRALILGVRASRIAGCPGRCLLGRGVSSALVRAETQLSLADTQCGLRVYPLGLVHALRCRAERFGYETEVIVRAAWAGCEILEAPVACVYEVPGGRVSHWRPFVDTLREGVLHARLFARSIAPIPHRQWPAGADACGPTRRRGSSARALPVLAPASLTIEADHEPA